MEARSRVVRRRTLLLCAAVCIQQSIANAQCLNCQTQQPAYYYAMPTQQPGYYYATQQPTYYSVDSWAVCNSSGMNACDCESTISYEPCKPSSDTYPIFKPVRSVDEFGNEIIRWVPEQRTRTYTTTTGVVGRPPLVQVPYKGKPLTLTGPGEQGE